jgi:hypothetical protein
VCVLRVFCIVQRVLRKLAHSFVARYLGTRTPRFLRVRMLFRCDVRFGYTQIIRRKFVRYFVELFSQ